MGSFGSWSSTNHKTHKEPPTRDLWAFWSLYSVWQWKSQTCLCPVLFHACESHGMLPSNCAGYRVAKCFPGQPHHHASASASWLWLWIHVISRTLFCTKEKRCPVSNKELPLTGCTTLNKSSTANAQCPHWTWVIKPTTVVGNCKNSRELSLAEDWPRVSV
jgi:hypothetical protein